MAGVSAGLIGAVVDLQSEVNSSSALIQNLTATVQSLQQQVTQLSGLSDVDLTGLQNGNVLQWDSSLNKWVPASID